MSCEDIFKRPHDLEYYLPISAVKNTTIYDDGTVKEVFTSASIYSSPTCLEEENIGEYRVMKSFDDILRIGYYTTFFNKQSGIYGSLASFFPTDTFDSSGVLTTDGIGRIIYGGGDFIFSSGYTVTTAPTKEKPYFYTRAYLSSNNCN